MSKELNLPDHADCPHCQERITSEDGGIPTTFDIAKHLYHAHRDQYSLRAAHEKAVDMIQVVNGNPNT